MNEDLLHYMWKYQRVNRSMQTTDGKPIFVENPGWHNTDAGPDFFNAKVRIGNTLWAGNIEIHLKSSDWFLHRHNVDKAFDNIILHIVFEEDKSVFDKNGNKIPTIELKNIIDPDLIVNYKTFLNNKNPIPCSNLLKNVDNFVIFNWLEKLAVERLQDKTDYILSKLELNKNHWEQAFYEIFARNFGFKLNAEPFELLAKSLPQQYFAKSKNNLFQIEALLFGQAGMLEENFQDDYPNRLKAEYDYNRKKYKLKPIQKHLWKFLRIRPSNFPTIRIAQFANLIYKSDSLFSKLIECQNVKQLSALLHTECSNYWLDHYIFDKTSRRSKKQLHISSINLLIINTIIPFIFTYGKSRDDYKFTEKALELLSGLPPEKNHITEKFCKAGIEPKNAMQSQSMIQLYTGYCCNKKCLQCSIGAAILNDKKDFSG